MARRLEPGEELRPGGGDLSTLGRPCGEARKATLRHVTPRREAELHDHPSPAVTLNAVADLLRDESTLRGTRAWVQGRRLHPEDQRPRREESQP